MKPTIKDNVSLRFAFKASPNYEARLMDEVGSILAHWHLLPVLGVSPPMRKFQFRAHTFQGLKPGRFLRLCGMTESHALIQN
jgi:hypothetical protein